MICPYMPQTEVSGFSQTAYFDEDKTQIGYGYSACSKYIPQTCRQDDCGAWRDGHCCFNRKE